MDLQKQRKIILRYLSGKATPNEIEWVETWYKSFEKESLNVAEISKEETERSKHFILLKILKTNNFYKINAIYRYAAILLLLGFCGLIILKLPKVDHKDRLVTISTDDKKDTTFTLPDSSVVWLNRNSKVTYNASTFTIKKRRVYLEKGEAYFEVRRDTSSRFSVVSNKMSVNVLGTGFNIYSDERLGRFNVMGAMDW